MANEITTYKTDTGVDIELSPDIVRRYLCPDKRLTDQDVMLFIELCKANRLNPFIKECYLIKSGDRPAQIQAGKDAFTKRAARNPRFRGYEAGLTVVKDDNGIERREGSMTLPGETIAGGWCKVYVQDYERPMFDEVSFNEYARTDRNGYLSGSWAKMPGTMIRKVAVCHALREAFPEDLSGLYDASELEEKPVENVDEQPTKYDDEILQVNPEDCPEVLEVF